jgi:hypothetical protein
LHDIFNTYSNFPHGLDEIVLQIHGDALAVHDKVARQRVPTPPSVMVSGHMLINHTFRGRDGAETTPPTRAFHHE